MKTLRIVFAFIFLFVCAHVLFAAATYEGAPLYAARKTQSSPLSAHGSHYGVKTDVDENAFFSMISYTTLTRMQNTELDRFFVTLKTRDGELLLNPEKRHVAFSYIGWKEFAKEKNMQATSFVLFADTDVLLLYVEFVNTGKSDAVISPVLHFSMLGANYKSENMYVPSYPQPSELDSHTTLLNNGGVLRTLYSSLERTEIKKDDSGIQLVLQEKTLHPSDHLSCYFLIGFTTAPENKNVSIDAVMKAKKKINPASMFYAAELFNWKRNFLSKLPLLPKKTKQFAELYKLAATGLSMNLYAPRNKMTKFCAVPAKVHFNNFWGWDTPFESMGQSEFDPALAWDSIRIQFETQAKNGMVYQILADDMKKVMWNFSQSPVQGWALKKLFEQDTDRKRAMENLKWFYPKLKAYIEWFKKNRDADGDGLLEALNPYEEWDDTPRLIADRKAFASGTANTQHIDNLTTTSWALLNERILKEFAHILNLKDDARMWDEKIKNFSQRMDEGFWDEECQCWLDYDTKEKKHVNVLTPAVWFPAFARATKDLKRVKTVIEKHLLNPQEFFGAYPVPTVAYNDSHYNHADDGTYWSGQIWLNMSFVTLQTLFQYGYEKEADELLQRTLKMLVGKGGLYENYNALTGDVGLSSKGKGFPCAFQLGWSCSFTMQMLQKRYERERFLLERGEPAKTVRGFIHKIKTFPDEETFLEVVSEPYSFEVPYLVVKSLDGKPLDASKKISIQLLSEGKNFKNKTFYAHFKTRAATFIFSGPGKNAKKKMYFPREGGGTYIQVPVRDTEAKNPLTVLF